MSEHITLSDLPENHPLRSRLLSNIEAEVRNDHLKTWRSVDTWRIGKATYNDLRGPWREHNEFRCPAKFLGALKLTERGDTVIPNDIRKAVRAAIAKAEGGQP